MMHARFKHTCVVARNWDSLARFYEEVFGCVRVPPERRLSGSWLERGTGVSGATVSGVHLHLPGYDESGPTLEIFQYARSEEKPPPRANREGFSHIAFEVENVAETMERVLRCGGSTVGELSSAPVAGMGTLTFVYLADPEGNILELQSWK